MPTPVETLKRRPRSELLAALEAVLPYAAAAALQGKDPIYRMEAHCRFLAAEEAIRHEKARLSRSTVVGKGDA